MLRVIGNRVLIKGFENPMISPGGIHIPETSRGKPCKGEVVGVGNMVKNDISIGDIVLFSPMGAVEINDNGEKYLLLKEDLIYAIDDGG